MGISRKLSHFLSTTFFECIITFFIVTNVVIIVLTSEPSLNLQHHPVLVLFESLSIFVFSVEYIVRAIAYRRPSALLKPLMICDFIVLITFFLGMRFGYFRLIRLLKLLSILHLPKYKEAYNLITSVLKREKEAFVLVLVFFIILLIIASSIMYFIEGSAHSDFNSIPKALYWAVITCTSVGYGDVVPITALGKIFGGMTAVLGVLFYSIMTSIFASGFMIEFSKAVEKK